MKTHHYFSRLAIAGLALAWIRFAGPPIYCGDGYFHIRVAEVLRHEGLAQSLPTFQEALPRDDLNLLYHLLLIPFTFGDLLRGAQLAGIAGGMLAAAAFWGALRALRTPQPLAFTVLLLAGFVGGHPFGPAYLVVAGREPLDFV